MSTWLIIVIVVAGILLLATPIVAFVIWNSRQVDDQRAAALRRLKEESANRGWTYEERNDSYAEWFTRLHGSSAVQAREARNIVAGTYRGRQFIAAEFHVYNAGDWQVSANFFDALAIYVQLPSGKADLAINRTTQLAATVNRATGEISSAIGIPAFDNKFEVNAADENFAKQLLSPELVEYLLSTRRQFRSISIVKDQLDVADQVDNQYDPAELIPALDFRCDIIDRIPASVWN